MCVGERDCLVSPNTHLIRQHLFGHLRVYLFNFPRKHWAIRTVARTILEGRSPSWQPIGAEDRTTCPCVGMPARFNGGEAEEQEDENENEPCGLRLGSFEVRCHNNIALIK